MRFKKERAWTPIKKSLEKSLDTHQKGHSGTTNLVPGSAHQHLSALRELHVDWLPTSAAACLARDIADLQTLEVLTWRGCRVGLAQIASALAQLSKLRRLDLSDADYEPSMLAPLAAASSLVSIVVPEACAAGARKALPSHIAITTETPPIAPAP